MHDLKPEHASPDKEEALIAAITESPQLYYELDLSKEIFFEHGDLYEKIASAIEANKDLPTVPDGWSSTEAPTDVAQELKRSWKRYHVELFRQEELARVLGDDDSPEEFLRGMKERVDQLLSDLESAFDPGPTDNE